MYFISCPKQGLEMGAVVLHRVEFLEYFCPKQGQDFKPSAALIYPNMGQLGKESSIHKMHEVQQPLSNLVGDTVEYGLQN